MIHKHVDATALGSIIWWCLDASLYGAKQMSFCWPAACGSVYPKTKSELLSSEISMFLWMYDLKRVLYAVCELTHMKTLTRRVCKVAAVAAPGCWSCIIRVGQDHISLLIRCIYGIINRETTSRTANYGVYIWFRPTLCIIKCCEHLQCVCVCGLMHMMLSSAGCQVRAAVAAPGCWGCIIKCCKHLQCVCVGGGGWMHVMLSGAGHQERVLLHPCDLMLWLVIAIHLHSCTC